MSVALTKVSAQGRPIRHCSIFNGRVVVIDRDALVHYFKWMTPRDTTSFTFNASSSQSDFSVEFDKTSELLNKQYGATVGDSGNHLAVLPRSGALLSIGHWDNSIRCYNLDDFKCVQSVSCHKDAITCAASQERVVVTGSRDTTVIVWRALKRTGKASTLPALQESPLHILNGHQDEVSCIALSAPLDLVISASVRGDILFHTLQTGEYVRQFHLPRGHVPTKMALRSNGILLLYCQQDLSLYTMTVNGRVLAAADIAERINSVAFSMEGEHVVVGGEKGGVTIRCAYTLRVVASPATSASPITCVDTTPEDCLLAANRAGELIVVSPG